MGLRAVRLSSWPKPDAEPRVFLQQDLRYVIVRDKLLLVNLSEYPFSDSEYLRQSSPCSAKEDGIEFAVLYLV
jgi:hypothetical protein